MENNGTNLLGIEPSRSRLPCLLMTCILRTLSANESDFDIDTDSSISGDLCALPFTGGRLSVKVSSTTLSKLVAVCRLRAGSWTLTVTSSTGLVCCCLCALMASSKSGVEDHEDGRCRIRSGAVTSTTVLFELSLEERFCVDVQLRTDLSRPSRLRLGVDEAMSSPRRAPCSL